MTQWGRPTFMFQVPDGELDLSSLVADTPIPPSAAAAEAEEQVKAVLDAVQGLVSSGALGATGATLSVSISGSANPGHAPVESGLNDAVFISITQVGYPANSPQGTVTHEETTAPIGGVTTQPADAGAQTQEQVDALPGSLAPAVEHVPGIGAVPSEILAKVRELVGLAPDAPVTADHVAEAIANPGTVGASTSERRVGLATRRVSETTTPPIATGERRSPPPPAKSDRRVSAGTVA